MKILFTAQAWERINLYIKHSTGEVSGLAVGKLNDEKDTIIINDLGIWKQECTSGETEVTSHNEMIALAEELIERGAKMEEVCVWWHSHADMAAFFSGTDENTIKNWITNKFLVAVVGNKKGEFKAKIKIANPIPCQIENIPVEYQAIEENESPLSILIKTEVEAKVKEPKPIPTHKSHRSHWNTNGKVYNQDNNWGKSGHKKLNKLSPAERAEAEIEWAVDCLCDECWEFNQGALKEFPYSTHNWNKRLWRWIPKNLEQQQISASRNMNQQIDEEYKEITKNTRQMGFNT